jgi:thioredoxin 1
VKKLLISIWKISKLKFYPIINVDDNQTLAQQFRVMSIPTVVFFKNGEAVNRFVGVREKNEYIDTMKSL